MRNAVAAWRRRDTFFAADVSYLVVHLGVVAAIAFANLFTHHGLVHHLSTWDGAWFLQALYNGYPSHLVYVHGQVQASPIAFFPLMPQVMRFGHDITRLSPPVVGLIVSFVTGLTATRGVGLLAEHVRDTTVGQKAALLFALTPGAFSFNLIYAEGILLTCMTYGIVALRERRWLRAGLLGLVASTASPVAAVYVVVCAVVALRAIATRRDWRSLLAPALAPLGGIGWVAFLWVHTGTPFAWQLTERGGWQSYPTLRYPFDILWQFLHNPISPTLTGHILFWGTVVGALGVWWCFKTRQPLELLTYITVAFTLFAVSLPVGLRPRFVMLLFPAVIAAAELPAKRYRWVLGLSSIVMLLFLYEELTSFAVFP